MSILLDTHIYLWWINGDKRLTNKARHLIERAEKVYVSAASIWELGIKIQSGKFNAILDELIEKIYTSGFTEIPLTIQHSKQLMSLPRHHNDPFDRMLIAQAMSEPLKFLTADKKLTVYSELVELV